MKKFVKVMAVALVAVMVLALLVACGPNSDPDKAVAALKDNGYTATKVSTGSYAGLTAVVTGSKGLLSSILGGEDDFQFIMIYYFESSSAANDAWDAIQGEADKNSNKKNDSDWVVKKSGAMIYFGTKQAAKDAK